MDEFIDRHKDHFEKVETEGAELDAFLRDNVWTTRNTGSFTKKIILAEPELFVFPEWHCALQIEKAVVGKQSYVDFGLGTAEEYDATIEKLIAKEKECTTTITIKRISDREYEVTKTDDEERIPVGNTFLLTTKKL